MDNVIIGFTGTRSGMTDKQKYVVELLLTRIGGMESTKNPVGLHGDCIGADADFHNICRKLGMKVNQRPCTFENLRAHTDATEISEPTNPMARNRQIVADCSVLVACPPNDTELKRSGTWATIRMGRKLGDIKQVVIIYPDGNMVMDCHGLAGAPVYD